MTEVEAAGGDEFYLAVVRLAQEIRRLRKAANLSQPDLAGIVGYTPQYISLAERPHKGLPSAILVEAIDRALGAGGALIRLHEQAKAHRQALHASSSRGEMPVLPVAFPGENDVSELEGVETSKRRELTTVAAAVAFGATLDEPAMRIIVQADEPQIPATVRPGDIRELRATTEMLEARDHQVGGTPVRHHILGALRWGVELLNGSCMPEVRRTLAATVAQLADLAAWATFDAGLNTQARELFLLGLRAAHESGDLGIRAHVATGLARQEIHTGNPDAALELVQLAHTAADVLTPNAVSMLHAVKALAYAKKPDSTQCRRFIQLTMDHYKPESIENDPPWLRFFTLAKLNGDTANALFDLLITNLPQRDVRAELVTCLSDAVERYPSGRARGKAIAAARLAALLYLGGEPAEANEAARTALTVAENVRSARLGSDLRVLAHAAGAAPRDSLAQTIRAEANVLAAMMT
ncbi:MAG: helix-turn-helix transcriptional regulator [Pseudonocardiaceae bacterium]